MINIKSISHTTVNDLKPNATQTYHSKKIAMQSEAGSLFALSTFRFRTVFPGFFRPSLSLSLMQKYPHPTPTVLSLYSPLPPYTPLIIIIIIIISHTNRLLLNAVIPSTPYRFRTVIPPIEADLYLYETARTPLEDGNY